MFSLLLLTIGMISGGHVKFLAFPEVEGDTVEARVLLPQGTPLWRTEAVVDRLVSALESVNAELSPRQPDGLINLIHYDDAATLCLAALERGQRGSIYLGCDRQPITRAELVEATLRSGKFPDARAGTTFDGKTGSRGRCCDARRTRERLDWSPRFPSFAGWLSEAGPPAE